MSESGEFNPGPWRAVEHSDFKAERRRYDHNAGRAYQKIVSGEGPKVDLLPSSLRTDAESALVVSIDGTYSMGDDPGIMFGKLPYFDVEGKSYLGQSRAVSLALVQDASSDNYGIIARPFCNGLDLKKRLEEIVPERNGGEGFRESYELCALYYARNASMPKAVGKPIFIFFGDEAPYEFVDKDDAKKYAKVNLEKRITTKQIFQELREKFSVYIIRRPYGNAFSGTRPEDRLIHKEWVDLLGEDHVGVLSEPERILDVIFGVLAKERDKIDYFKEEIEYRQIESVKPDERAAGIEKVKSAYRALVPIFGKRLEVDRKWTK
jgi:hypothetical protein